VIAVSSFRPFADCAKEIRANQLAAKASWDKVFDRIIYFGDPEPELASPGTEFIQVSNEGAPSIKSIAEVCGRQEGWSCIINADIVVGRHLRRVEKQLNEIGAECTVSRRYRIPPDRNLSRAKLVDGGLDFFGAQSHVWKRVAGEILPEFRIGKVVWDTWMMNFFSRNYKQSCYDLTPSKIFFHPDHRNRRNQKIDVPLSKEERERRYWPTLTLPRLRFWILREIILQMAPYPWIDRWMRGANAEDPSVEGGASEIEQEKLSVQ
jgi:hypothetical protein